LIDGCCYLTEYIKRVLKTNERGQERGQENSKIREIELRIKLKDFSRRLKASSPASTEIFGLNYVT